MNLKDHLKNNERGLAHKAPKEIWDQINNKIQLADQKKEPKNYLYKIVGFAMVSLVVLFIAWQYTESKKAQEEIIALKETMTVLLNEQSVGKRIKAVTMSEELTDGNQEIAQVLIKTMINDPSNNVRLAAINALSHYVNNETVRIAIIEHLSIAKDPYVQIKLINILSKIKEKKAVPTLDDIIKETENIIVKQKAEEGRAYIKRT